MLNVRGLPGWGLVEWEGWGSEWEGKEVGRVVVEVAGCFNGGGMGNRIVLLGGRIVLLGRLRDGVGRTGMGY